MIAKLKTLILAALAAVAVIAATFKSGERRGKQSAAAAQSRRRIQATQDMKEAENEIATQDDPHLVDTLSKFVRK